MKEERRRKKVADEITKDLIWKLEVYRLALFAGDIGWQDVLTLSKDKWMVPVADQLHRSLDSISANLTEGYSRSKDLTVPASSNFPSARHVKAATGTTNRNNLYLLKSSNIE